MKTISELVLKNFKFFYGEQIINFNNKNILLYGENGSGKSSIYWALYTLLQSSTKKSNEEKIRILKYFDKGDEDSLVNRYMDESDKSLIAIKLNNESKYIVSIEATNTNLDEDPTIYESYTTSDFINYKLLAKNFDLKHSKNLEIFEFLANEILDDLLIKNKSKTFGKWLKQLRFGYMPTRQNNYYSSRRSLNSDLELFIFELKEFLSSITQDVNDILKQYFDLKFEVFFEVENIGITNDTRIRKIDGKEKRYTINSIYQPIVNMYLKNSDDSFIHKPHTFLNEAKQTAIALSIRFAILKSKAISEDTLKILVLDDLLVSLDMSNRDIVLQILLNDEHFQDYQIIILTHDRLFFELAKHKFDLKNKDDWKYFEIYEKEKDNRMFPFIIDSLSYLEKAEKYYLENEYEIAGNFLRKEAESFCKKFLPRKCHYTSECTIRDLNGLIIECKKFAENSGLDITLFDNLNTYRKFVLNSTSHDSYDVPKFKSEIKNCLDTLKELGEIKSETFLKKGMELEFDCKCDNGDMYKFELILEDEFRLIKVNPQKIVISKGIINYKVKKNGNYTKTELQHDNCTLENFYKRSYEKSDKSKNSDFLEEIIIKENGIKLKDICS